MSFPEIPEQVNGEMVSQFNQVYNYRKLTPTHGLNDLNLTHFKFFREAVLAGQQLVFPRGTVKYCRPAVERISG